MRESTGGVMARYQPYVYQPETRRNWWLPKPKPRGPLGPPKNPVTAYIQHDDFQGAALTFRTRAELAAFVKRNLDPYHNMLVAMGHDNKGMFSLMYVAGERHGTYKLVELAENEAAA